MIEGFDQGMSDSIGGFRRLRKPPCVLGFDGRLGLDQVPLCTWPVSERVNRVGHDGPACLERAAPGLF